MSRRYDYAQKFSDLQQPSLARGGMPERYDYEYYVRGGAGPMQSISANFGADMGADRATGLLDIEYELGAAILDGRGMENLDVEEIFGGDGGDGVRAASGGTPPLSLLAPAPPSARSWLEWLTLGVSVAGLAVGLTALARAQKNARRLR